MRRVLCALLAVVSFVFLAAAGVRAEGEDTPLWRDPSRLNPLFEEALDAVEAHRGTPFTHRPKLAISRREELEKVLRRELRPQLESTGQIENLDAAVALYARAMMAKCDLDANRIHLNAELFEDEDVTVLDPESITPDFFRVLFVHEATHAHDIPRYGWAERLRTVGGVDALKALDAVMEGHAQFVTQRVATRWGKAEAFAEVTAAILRKPEVEQEFLRMMLDVLHAELTFSYAKGQAFLEAVHAAQGDAGVEAVLQEPPTTTRFIEHPEEFLDPDRAAPEIDLERALDAFAALAGDAQWTKSKARVKDVALEAIRPQVPEELREGFLDGLQDGRVLVAQIPAEQRQLVVMLLDFEAAEQAKHFLRAERAIQEQRDEGELPPGAEIVSASYEEGAGPDDALVGFRARKTIRFGPLEMDVASHTFVAGAVFGQILRVQVPEVTEEHECGAIARLLHYLEDPEAAERTRAFDVEPIPLESQTRPLVLRVTDPDGNPVASARVMAAPQEPSSHDDPFSAMRGERAGRVRDGHAKLRLPKDAVRVDVLVYRASGEDGEPLDLAPWTGRAVLLDEVEDGLEVTLTPGARITGRIVDAGGAPVAGLRVSARPARQSGGGYDALRVAEHAQTRSGGDGAFTLRGLADATDYEVEVLETDDYLPLAPTTVAAGDQDVQIAMRRGTVVRVQILDPEGEPVVGAALEVEPQWTEGPPPRSWTLASKGTGWVEFPALDPDERYQLEIQPPDDREDLARWFRIDWQPKAGAVVLEPGFTARGIVVDSKGTPLAGLRVETRPVELAATEHRFFLDQQGTDTGPDGRFVLRHLPRGPVEIAVTGRAWRARGWMTVIRPADDAWTTVRPDSAEVTLHFDAPPRVRVRILDAAGQPVPRSEVGIQQGGTTDYTTARQGEVELEVRRAADAFTVLVQRAFGEDGAVLPLAPARVTCEPGTASVEIRLEPGLTIAGRVVDESGSPLARVTLAAARPDSRFPLGRHSVEDAMRRGWSVTTDAEGHFVLPGLGAGPHAVLAQHPDHPDSFVDEVEAGRDDLVITMPTGRRYAVRVTGPDDQPLAGIRVRLVHVTEQGPGSRSYSYPATGRTDASGTWQTPTVDATAHYQLRVEPDDRYSDFLELVRDWKPRDVTLQIERGFRARGVVLDADGHPVARAGVQVRSHRGGISTTRTDAAGRFETDVLPPVPATLQAYRVPDELMETGEYDRFVETGKGPTVEATPESAEVVLRLLAPPVTVALRIEGAKEGESVWVMREPGAESADDGGDRTAMGRTAADGSVRLSLPLPPGRYRVLGVLGDDRRIPYRRDLRVPEDLDEDGTVAIERVETRTIRVVLHLPPESRFVEVVLDDPLLRGRRAPEVEPGVYAFEGLPPGTWHVRVKARGPDAWLRKTVEVEAGNTIEVDLREPAGVR